MNTNRTFIIYKYIFPILLNMQKHAKQDFTYFIH